MRAALQLVGCGLAGVFLALPAPAHSVSAGRRPIRQGGAGQTHGLVLDRVAAVVNGRPIMQSQIEDAAWFALFSAGFQKPAPAVAPALSQSDLDTALQHLIDDWLIEDERVAGGAAAATDDEVKTQLDHLRQNAGGDAALESRLHIYHLDDVSLAALLKRQLSILEFEDLRLGNSLAISEDEIENYYNGTFVPEAKARGIEPAPLDEVRSNIRAILQQRQVVAAEPQWLDSLRQSAVIHINKAGNL